jgi:hypothetical protein
VFRRDDPLRSLTRPWRRRMGEGPIILGFSLALSAAVVLLVVFS